MFLLLTILQFPHTSHFPALHSNNEAAEGCLPTLPVAKSLHTQFTLPNTGCACPPLFPVLEGEVLHASSLPGISVFAPLSDHSSTSHSEFRCDRSKALFSSNTQPKLGSLVALSRFQPSSLLPSLQQYKPAIVTVANLPCYSLPYRCNSA